MYNQEEIKRQELLEAMANFHKALRAVKDRNDTRAIEPKGTTLYKVRRDRTA